MEFPAPLSAGRDRRPEPLILPGGGRPGLQDPGVPTHDLGQRVASHLRELGIDILHATRGIRDDHKAGTLLDGVRQLEELLLDSVALGELADLAAEPARQGEQGVVGRLDLPAEELEHAEDRFPELDWEAEGAVQARFDRGRCPRGVAVPGDIGDPGGSAAGPDAAGELVAGREGRRPGQGVEFGDRDRRPMPGRDAAQHPGLGVHPPRGSEVPPQPLADRLEDPRDGLGERRRLSQDARRGQLSGQPGQGPVVLSRMMPMVSGPLTSSSGLRVRSTGNRLPSLRWPYRSGLGSLGHGPAPCRLLALDAPFRGRKPSGTSSSAGRPSSSSRE